MDIVCPNCNSANRPGSHFCARCGTLLLGKEGGAEEVAKGGIEAEAETEESAPALDLPWLQGVQERAVQSTERLPEEPVEQTGDQAPEVTPPVAPAPTVPPSGGAEQAGTGVATPAEAPQESTSQQEASQVDAAEAAEAAAPTDAEGRPDEPPPDWVLGILEPSVTPQATPGQEYDQEELAHIMPWEHGGPGEGEGGAPGLPPWLGNVTVQETLQTGPTGPPTETPDAAELGLDADIEPFVPPGLAEEWAEGGERGTPIEVPEWLRTISPESAISEPLQPQPQADTALRPVAPVPGTLGIPGTPGVPEAEAASRSLGQTQVRAPRAGAAETLAALVQPAADAQQTAVPTSALPEAAPRRRGFLGWLLPDGIIYALILAALLTVLLVRPPFGDVALPAAAGVQEFYNAVDSAPSDKPVLVVYDWDATRSAEMSVLSEAVMRHMMSRRLNFVTISTMPQGPGFAQQVTADVRGDYGYEYGRDYLVLGYLPGHEAALAALVSNFRASLPRDYVHSQPVAASQLMAGRKLDGLDDFSLIVALSSEEAELRNWIEQVSVRARVPMVAAVPQALEPLARPYLDVPGAGLNALVSGLSGALQYSQHLQRSGRDTALPTGGATLTDRLNTQSVAQLLIAAIILAALVRVALRRLWTRP